MASILDQWLLTPWGRHTDNGTEFLNAQLVRFVRARGLQFSRSRPYCKDDDPHVEHKKLQSVRHLVGYARYDTPADVERLNQVDALLDVYVNLFSPSPSPKNTTTLPELPSSAFARPESSATQAALQRQIDACNPLAVYRKL